MIFEKHFAIINIMDVKKYGSNSAIILSHIQGWIKHNIRKKHNYRDGKFWTYGSISSLRKELPCFTEGQIYTAIKKLIDAGVLITGNYNLTRYDRTLWYAFADEAERFKDDLAGRNPETEIPEQVLNYISHEPGMMAPVSNSNNFHFENNKNGIQSDQEPIPIKNPINKKNKKREREEPASAGPTPPFVEIMNIWNDIAHGKGLSKCIAMDEKREKAIRSISSKTPLKTVEDWREYITRISGSDFLMGKNDRGWKANFSWAIKPENVIKVLEGNYGSAEYQDTFDWDAFWKKIDEKDQMQHNQI